MHTYHVITWFFLYPIPCTTDMDCVTKNPWLGDIDLTPLLENLPMW